MTSVAKAHHVENSDLPIYTSCPMVESDSLSQNSSELQSFHSADILLYKRIVGLNKPPFAAKMVISLWFCLEEVGYFDLLQNICLCDNEVVELIFNETLSCLDCIGPLATRPGRNEEDLLMSKLVAEPINRSEVENQQAIPRSCADAGTSSQNQQVCGEAGTSMPNQQVCSEAGTSTQNQQVCSEAGTSTQNQEVSRAFSLLSLDPLARPYFRAETSTQNQQVCGEAGISTQNQQVCGASSSSSLDPLARPYCGNETLPPEQRTIFLTFSRGYPIPWEDIVEFFTKRWGDIIEDLIMEKDVEEPNYARLVLRNVLSVLMILNGKDVVKFNIKGKHLRGRLFIARKPADRKTD
ncbi:hypothetical protein AQUCO_00200038v1 [Aquilegia coerulea]|uniref:Uncharacterized protein n=1 Tax=Aquilegia coerulea TaxID=218851 RepID=A0A2G5F181_AQUCA|nr:hypothetical protein AQUCO_00200038v1 [Aquilegia coerulea]